jgi:iron complex transport system ATP-binding protein
VSAELPGRQTLTTSGFEAILTGFFSSSTLWPNLTVTDAMRERAEEIVHEVGAEKLRAKPVGEMSAGQQRRIMIGRAMAGASEDGRGEVQMLLLDEPSNALDLAAQHDLREMLRKLAQRGIAILLITHHIADILPEMKRIVMMREGRVIADGTKSDLLTAEKLSELFGRDIQMSERDGYFNAW